MKEKFESGFCLLLFVLILAVLRIIRTRYHVVSRLPVRSRVISIIFGGGN